MPRIARLVSGLVFAVMPLLLACNSAIATPTPVPGLPVILAVSELVVGEETRLAFAVLDDKNKAIREPEVGITLFSIDEEEQTLVRRGEGKAVFRPWPSGHGGVYTLQIIFPTSGTWILHVEVPSQEGPRFAQSIPFPVLETSVVQAIGAAVPRSVNKTARDVNHLAELTTAHRPDPDLYQLTIAEGIDAGKPLVVSFATPLLCSTATCGPQVEVISQLKERFRGHVNFIHVEIYDNPVEMGGDVAKGRISPVVSEWGLPSEPWTFIVDKGGLLAAKFEAFTSLEELEPIIQRLLQ